MVSWDDGKQTKVKKVQITYGDVINSVKFEYESNGTTVKSDRRGGVGSKSAMFTLNTDEYITDVTGYYTTGANSEDVITAITFTSNQRTHGPYGKKTRNYFSVYSPKDNQIVGFLGSSSNVINSIDVHFGPIVSSGNGGSGSGAEKGPAQGGKGGKEWDDGNNHDGVRKIIVGVGRKGIHYIKFYYEKNGQLKDSPFHGVTSGASSPPPTFEIDQPGEYLVSVVGYYQGDTMQGLQFKTNKKESQVFGYSDGTKITLEAKDKKIVGFHGFADTTLNSIGAYFASVSSTLPSSINKLEAQGGKGGTTFDDGAFDDVRKVYVGQGASSVAYVKFEYNNGGKLETREHGKKGMLGEEEFPLEDGEYITSVEGYYDKIFGHQVEVIAALTFKTSKNRTSQPFGITAGTKFELDGKGGKLLGFHGSADEVLYSLGAYFAPPTTPLTPAN